MSYQPSSSHVSASQSRTRTSKDTPAQYSTATQRKPSIQENGPYASDNLIKYRVLHDVEDNTVSYTNIMDDEELAMFRKSNQRPRGRSPPVQAASFSEESGSDSDVEHGSARMAEAEPNTIPDEFYQGYTTFIDGKKYWVTNGLKTRKDLLAEIMPSILRDMCSHDSVTAGSARSASIDSLDTVERALRKRNKGQDKGKSVDRDEVLLDRTHVPDRPQWKTSHRTQDSKSKESQPQRHHEIQTFMSCTNPRIQDPTLNASDISVFQSPKGQFYSWITHVCSFDQGPPSDSDRNCHTCGKLNYLHLEKSFQEQMQGIIRKLMASKVDKRPSDMLIARRNRADGLVADMVRRFHEFAARGDQDCKTEEEKQTSNSRRNDRTMRNDLTDKEKINKDRIIAAYQLEKAGDPEMLKLRDMRNEKMTKLMRKYPGIFDDPFTEEEKKIREAYFKEMSKVKAEYNEQVTELVGW